MRDQMRPSMQVRETKQFGGQVVEHKEIVRETPEGPIRLGIVEVLLATWEPDTGGIFGIPDQFEQGAFAESLLEHRSRNNRQIRLKDGHGRVVGGFPIDQVVETNAGLFAVGEINLEMQQGQDVWALIKQGVFVDMSIGFTALMDRIVGGIRVISKAIIWEGSVVSEPANRAAGILGFKSTPFTDLPLAEKGYAWDPVAATQRVEQFAGANQIELKSAYAQQTPDGGGLGNLIADVVDGRLVVVPDAVVEAASGLIGVDGTEAIVEHLERYLAKSGTPSPMPAEQRRFFGAEEAREMKAADLERALASGAIFSTKAAKAMSARLTGTAAPVYDPDSLASIYSTLLEMREDLKQG